MLGIRSTRDWVEFGEFRLNKESGRLFKQGQNVPLGHRAAMILTLLAERAGDVVTQDELIDYVWPKTVVEQNNLRVQISAVRKALRIDSEQIDYIRNIPGRGYQLIVPDIQTTSITCQDILSLQSELSSVGLIGRDDTLNVILLEIYSARRLITLIGPCGVGKTSVALSVARQVYDDFCGKVLLIDMESVNSPDQISSIVQTSLGTSDNATLTSQFGPLADGQKSLLVLDNCKDFVDEIFIAIPDLVHSIPGLKILAVSDVPLGLSHEFVYRLPPLQCPPPDFCGQNAYQLLKYPAASLFIEKAISTSDRFSVSARDGDALTLICNQLDGLPLAIEIAASYAAEFGVQHLANTLKRSTSFFLTSSRSMQFRSQKLRKSLDRGFNRLADVERSLLLSLAELPGPFSLKQAIDNLSAHLFTHPEIVGGILSLADKSFLTHVDTEGGTFRMSNIIGRTLRICVLQAKRRTLTAFPLIRKLLHTKVQRTGLMPGNAVGDTDIFRIQISSTHSNCRTLSTEIL